MQYEQLLHSVMVSEKNSKDHPLLKYITDMEKNQKLPKNLIGDPERLQQVAFNIISNAIQHTNEGSIVVYVSFDKLSSKVVFIVKDEGRGIKKEDQRTIFQCLSTTPSKYDQNNFRLSDGNQIGLGLFVSKQIVMSYGGQLDFFSNQEEGSTFIFSFECEVNTDQEMIRIQVQEMEASSEESEVDLNDISPRPPTVAVEQ